MLQIIGILYIVGWVLGLVALIIILIRYFKKSRSISSLYKYSRYIDIFIPEIQISAYEHDRQMLIDNKEERRIETWDTSDPNKKIHLRSMYYIHDTEPVDLTKEIKIHDAGYGGSGYGNFIIDPYRGIGLANNPTNPYSYIVNTYINQYYAPKFVQDGFNGDPDQTETCYKFKIVVRIIFISDEVFMEFDSKRHKSIANSYLYVVNRNTKYNDVMYMINSDGYLSNIPASSAVLNEIPYEDRYNIIESKRKSNYRLFKHLNLYLRNGDE